MAALHVASNAGVFKGICQVLGFNVMGLNAKDHNDKLTSTLHVKYTAVTFILPPLPAMPYTSSLSFPFPSFLPTSLCRGQDFTHDNARVADLWNGEGIDAEGVRSCVDPCDEVQLEYNCYYVV